MREIVDDRIGHKSTPDPSLRPPNCLNFESGPWRGALFFFFFLLPGPEGSRCRSNYATKILGRFFHHAPPLNLTPKIYISFFLICKHFNKKWETVSQKGKHFEKKCNNTFYRKKSIFFNMRKFCLYSNLMTRKFVKRSIFFGVLKTHLEQMLQFTPTNCINHYLQ